MVNKGSKGQSDLIVQLEESVIFKTLFFIFFTYSFFDGDEPEESKVKTEFKTEEEESDQR